MTEQARIDSLVEEHNEIIGIAADALAEVERLKAMLGRVAELPDFSHDADDGCDAAWDNNAGCTCGAAGYNATLEEVRQADRG